MALLTPLVLGACQREAEPGHDAPPVPAPSALRGPTGPLGDEARAAALRGIEYLIGKRPEMSPDWSTSIFGTLYKIAPDEALAERVHAIFEQALREPQAALPSDPDSPELLDPRRLQPLLNELWRRKLLGEPWQREAAALQALVEEHEEALWKVLLPGHQLLFLDLFRRVDIPTRRSQADVEDELRRLWSQGAPKSLLVSIPFMYGVTHVFYAGSGYFETRLDPARYATEIEIMDRALSRYLRKFPANTNFVDISAEILASRRLLGLPENATSRAMTRLLLERQNPDGSWLTPKGFQDYHATAAAIHAFLEYPPEFRRLEPGG